MTNKFSYWHLDGTWCPAGWEAETGMCANGGGPVTPRVLEGELPVKVEPTRVFMVALFSRQWGVTPMGLHTDEHSASIQLRRLMKEGHGKDSYYSVQPYFIGSEYGLMPGVKP